MSVDYQKKLDGIKTSFSLASDEYLTSFPQSQIYPNVNNYQDAHKRSKDLIKSINSDLFILENEISSNISSFGKEIKSINRNIQKIKEINENLEKESSNIEGKDKGAKVRFINSKQLSYTALYKTIFLTIIGFYTFIKLRKQNK